MCIKWRLAVVMAEQNVSNAELARQTGFSPVTVSRHKNMRTMPLRLERNTLIEYCKALGCQPGDLLRYVGDE